MSSYGKRVIHNAPASLSRGTTIGGSITDQVAGAAYLRGRRAAMPDCSRSRFIGVLAGWVDLSVGLSTMSVSDASDLNGKSPDRRKLIAVVYVDMVGYSRLIGLDDTGTLERLRTLRRNLLDPAILEHGGRIAQTGGDSCSSFSTALTEQCAVP